MINLKGMGVALVTPFKKDKSIDVEALKKIVQFQIKNNTDYLVVLGTTGEYATLTSDEREVVKSTIVEENAGTVPSVLGTVGNNRGAVVVLRLAEDNIGFEAILSVPRYYYKPSQEGMYQHYKALSEKTPLPLIVYNVPGRTSSNILPE